MRQWLATFLILSILPGCGWFQEKEAEKPTIVVEKVSSQGECQDMGKIVDWSSIQPEPVRRLADCLDLKIEEAFTSLRGQVPGDLSFRELKALKEKGLLDLPFDSDSAWEAFGNLLSLFHPHGTNSLNKERAQKWVKWFRHHFATISDHDNRNTENGDYQALIRKAVSDFIGFLYEESTVAKSDVLALVRSIVGKKFNDSTRRKIEAAWNLKSLALEKSHKNNIEDISGRSLQKLISLGVHLHQDLASSSAWHENLSPHKIPSDYVRQHQTASERLIKYIQENEFNEVDTEILQWSIRQFSPDSKLIPLVPDLVRLLQKTYSQDQWHKGAHASGLVPFVQAIPDIASRIEESAPHFQCEDWYCRVRMDSLGSKPYLLDMALRIGANYRPSFISGDDAQFSSVGTERDLPLSELPRWEAPVYWGEIYESLIEQGLITKAFSVLYPGSEGSIPYQNQTSRQQKELLDITSTLMRMTMPWTNEKDKFGRSLQRVISPPQIKPDVLFKLVGLAGDKLLASGNGDGRVCAEELFGALKLQQRLHTKASRYVGYERVFSPVNEAPNWEENFYYQEADMLKLMRSPSILTAYPHIGVQLRQLSDEQLDSLNKVFIGKPEKLKVRERWVMPDGHSGPVQELVVYPHRRLTTPLAYMEVLDQLLLNCDTDLDQHLSWEELDCVVPTLGEGLSVIIEGGLVDLPPGLHDLGRVAARLLGKENRVLKNLVKWVLINGGFRDLDKNHLYAEVRAKISIDWNQLGRILGAPTSGERNTPAAHRAWSLEARLKYGHLDKNRNGVIDGGAEFKEMSKVFSSLIAEKIAVLGAPILSQKGLTEFLSEQIDTPRGEVLALLVLFPEADLGELLRGSTMGASPFSISQLIIDVVSQEEL